VAIPTTPLGKIAANGKLVPAQPPPDTKSKLAQVIGGRRGEDATLPVIGPVWMELLGSAKSTEIAAAADREIAELGFTDGSAGAAIRFEAARALRTLAAGVRDPADHGKAFGTLDEWRDLVDDQLLNACWQAYGEMQERLDPLERPLTEEEFGAIEAAVKKKGRSRLEELRYCEAVRLACFYGRPACDLTDTELVEFGLLVGAFPMKARKPEGTLIELP
jgi:hypothetical protein